MANPKPKKAAPNFHAPDSKDESLLSNDDEKNMFISDRTEGITEIQ
jgi:hypothetical protein